METKHFFDILDSDDPREINEWSISRVYRDFKTGDTKSFALMTSWRSARERPANRATLKDFHADLERLVHLEGHGWEDDPVPTGIGGTPAQRLSGPFLTPPPSYGGDQEKRKLRKRESRAGLVTQFGTRA